MELYQNRTPQCITNERLRSSFTCNNLKIISPYFGTLLTCINRFFLMFLPVIRLGRMTFQILIDTNKYLLNG